MSELWYGPLDADEVGGYVEPADQRVWRERRAKQICATCLFVQPCLAAEMALPPDHQWGVRGGLTAAERRRLIREQRRAAAQRRAGRGAVEGVAA